MIISYWFYAALVYLGLLTWQDYTNKRRVDDRRNFFMLGFTIASILPKVKRDLVYIVALLVVISLLYMFMQRIKAIGGADTKTLSWLFLGLGYIGIPVLISFSALFCGGLMIITAVRIRFFQGRPLPLYGWIFGAFVLVGMAYRLYAL